MNNWYYNKIVLAAIDTATPPNPAGTGMGNLLDKFKDNAHTYSLDDVDEPTQNKLYQQTYDSYTKGETGEAFGKDEWFNRVRNGPWIFYGDKNFTGYITVRDLWEHKGLSKLTGCAGSKRGILCGMAALDQADKAVFGAVTPELYNMSIKAGWQTMDPETLKMFVQIGKSEVWGYGGKPKVDDEGNLSVFMPNFNKTITKKFICNPKFLQWVEQQKSTYMSQMMGGGMNKKKSFW